MKSDKQLVRQVYGAMLHLYPAEFRRGYAHELTLLFVDMYRDATAQGVLASVRLWLTMLLDLAASAVREWSHTMLNRRWAVIISLILFAPLALFFALDLANYAPPFVMRFFVWLFTPDDTKGKIF